MKRLVRSAILLPLVGVGIAFAAQVPLSLDHVCREAERIVVGEVTQAVAVNDEWPGLGEITYTDVTIRIEERYKGPADAETLTVRVPGGTDPETGLTLSVSGTPSFRIGERVLVFAKNQFGKPWVYGWSQGKYEIVVKRVVGQTGGPIGEDILLFALKSKIESILLRQAAEPTKEPR